MLWVSGQPDGRGALGLRLRGVKNAGYGHAWRKRGELLSIVTDLGRKYNRPVWSLDAGPSASDERVLETVGDLWICACKYLAWQAEPAPEAFDAASPVDAASFDDDGGVQPLARVLGAQLLASEGVSSSDAWASLKSEFNVSDQGLVAQAQGDAPLGGGRKTELAWRIASDSANLLVSMAQEDPARRRA